MLSSLALAFAPMLQEPGLVRPSQEDQRRGWLLEHQDPDGRWDADGFTKHDPETTAGPPAGLGRLEDDVLATSLVLWACLGDGRQLGAGPDSDTMARGVRWLLRAQDLETGLVREAPHALDVQHHAVATLVLCDLQFLEPGPLIQDACRRAVAALADVQAPDGSWGDARCTAWALLALEAARDAGLQPREVAVTRGEAWLRAGRDASGVLRAPSGEVDAVATGLDVLRELVTRDGGAEEPDATSRGALVLATLAREDRARDGETWFVAAALAYQLGGDAWKAVQRTLRREVLDTQVKGGRYHGSWDPRGAPGGRVVETSWNALTLEIYFRYACVFPAR